LAACASRATSAPSSGARDRPRRWAGAQWVRICLDPRLRRPTDPVRSVGWRSLPRPPLAPHGPAQESPPAVHRLRWLLVLHQPRLRSRLTLGRLPLPRNPQASGVGGSRSHWRYSFRHSRFGSLHGRSRDRFTATPERSPTTCAPWAARPKAGSRTHIRGFGGRLEPRYVLGAAPLDQ
jgi:hypothetical protein